MDSLDNLFSSNDEIVIKLKDYAKQLDYREIFFDHLGPELKKIFVNKKEKVIYKNFLEASQYEYGFFNNEIDLQKAFSLYKKHADSNDFLCMYKMHIIYLCEYEKFNVPLSRVLEKLYLLKCFAYLPNYVYEMDLRLFGKIDVIVEIAKGLDLEDASLEKHKKFFDLLYKEKEKYDLTENDINLMKGCLICYFLKEDEEQLDQIKFSILNSIKLTNDNDYSYYQAKNKCVYFRTYLNLQNIISEEFIEDFYNEVENKKLYEFYSDYGNYLLLNKINSIPKIIEVLTKSFEKGDLFGGYRLYIGFINIYDFDEIMSEYDKASNLLDMLLIQIVFEKLLLGQFIILIGYLIKYSNFSEKIITKYIEYVREIDNYVTNILNKEKKEEDILPLMANYIFKGDIYYFGFKDIEQQNLPKALEYFNKASNISINNPYYYQRCQYFEYNTKKLMNSLKMVSDDELKKEKIDLIELYKKNLNIQGEMFLCYIIGKDFLEGITVKKDEFITGLIFRSAVKNIVYQSIIDCKIKSELKKFLKNHQIENIYNDEICCICYEKKVDKIFIPCKHNFCSSCSIELQKNNECPVCRSKIFLAI